jgi:hypothetical protein
MKNNKSNNNKINNNKHNNKINNDKINNKSNNKNLDIHYMYTIDDTDYKNRTCNQYYLIVGSTQAFNEPIDIMIKALNTYKNMNLTLSYLNYNY